MHVARLFCLLQTESELPVRHSIAFKKSGQMLLAQIEKELL